MKTQLSFLHRVGNLIQALITILENLVAILTFSFWMPCWSIKFVMWRLDTKLYGNRRKT